MKLYKMEMRKNDLKNKVALITGTGRGIGKELPKNLAWLGASVVITEIIDEG
ncbi:MAG: hypothetical protein P8Y70_19590 [Candidatus Lokiarchaeota archaeon]